MARLGRHVKAPVRAVAPSGAAFGPHTRQRRPPSQTYQNLGLEGM